MPYLVHSFKTSSQKMHGRAQLAESGRHLEGNPKRCLDLLPHEVKGKVKLRIKAPSAGIAEVAKC